MNTTPNPTVLQLVLDGETEIVVRRDFTHPPARVWRALTEPDLIRKWMAARDDMTRCEVDLRPGGSFRYEWPEFFFSGPILEVVWPDDHHRSGRARSRDPHDHGDALRRCRGPGRGDRDGFCRRY